MPQLNHAADSPLQALTPITQDRNSRVCRSDAEDMETVWRSSSRGVSTRPRNSTIPPENPAPAKLTMPPENTAAEVAAVKDNARDVEVQALPGFRRFLLEVGAVMSRR